MTHAALTPLLGRQFDNFLFASIGEDQNGTTLSVLSALARLDVDPWEETASLARLPRERATERLAAVIAAARKDLATSLAPETIAARLVALLPQAASYNVPAPEALLKAAGVRPFRLFITLGVVAFLLAGYLIFIAHPSSGSGANSAATTSEAAAPRYKQSSNGNGQVDRRGASLRRSCAMALRRRIRRRARGFASDGYADRTRTGQRSLGA